MKDLNKIRFFISGNAFCSPRRCKKLLIDLSCDKFYLYDIRMKIYYLFIFLNISHNFFQWWNFLNFLTLEEEIKKWHVEAFSSSCWNWISFYSYFKVLHGFIMYMSTFTRIGIISKIWKVRIIVFKKQINKIYVTQQRHKYRSLRYTINNV